MKIYIASSWKNQHAVEMLTWLLRADRHTVLSFVENNQEEQPSRIIKSDKEIPFEEWVWSDLGERSFKYDTEAAKTVDLVIYIGPSGPDAWAEVGIAWGAGKRILGLHAKGEQIGLMRRMVHWKHSFKDVLLAVNECGGKE